MPPMTEHDQKPRIGKPSERYAFDDVPDWSELYQRIHKLALRRSQSMLEELFANDEEFDRGARALRTLMGAADISRRIKQSEEKEQSAHEEDPQRPAFTDEEIRNIYQSVSTTVDRLEREGRGGAAKGAEASPDDGEAGERAGANGLGDERP